MKQSIQAPSIRRARTRRCISRAASDGPFVTPVSFFRVVVSPHGRGHAAVLIEAPTAERRSPEKLCAWLTDNEKLAAWLVEAFVGRFATFRGLPALAALRYLPITSVTTSGDHLGRYTETIKSPSLDVALTWEGLGEPFLVRLPPKRSATGQHTMFRVFVEAERATAVVNGSRLDGTPATRDFLGRKGKTAFLAYSETRVRE